MSEEWSAETMRDGSRGKPAAATEPVLPTIERANYAIDKELARGGMGRIFTARDLRLDRVVAVKEVLGAEADLLMRFAREVKLTARLQHPGIVSIYEAGRWQTGEPFYAMRLIAGRPFDQEMAEATTLEQRIALVPKLLAVAEAMAYAHDQHIIHRDLKPANVLVGTYGETVVIDWGLAKDLLEGEADSLHGARPAVGDAGMSESLTVFGSVMGTPSYMPVEQATGQPLDARADVYALGAMLYQLLAGKPPYVGKTASRVLDDLVAGPPPALATVQPNVPVDLVAIVERAMERDARERYPSGKELADDLRRYLTGQLVASHAYTTGELVRRWLRRHRGPVAVAAVAALALVGLGIASYVKVVAEKGRADDERDAAKLAQQDAERSQATMLVDRARATIAAGTPARAAPLLAAAQDLGADGTLVAVLEGQVAEALPPSLWTRRVAHPEALAVANDGTLVTRPSAAAIAAKAGLPAGARTMLDPTGRLLVAATDDEIALWDVPTLTKRATTKGCLAEDDAALEIDEVTPAGTVVGVCRALDNSGGTQLAVWRPGSELVVGEVFTTGLRGVVASDDGRVVGAIEASVGAPRIARDGQLLTLGALAGATCVAIDADGRLVAAGTSSGFVQLWEVASGRELAVTSAGAPVVAIEFSPDGKLVVAAASAGTAGATATAWSTTGLLRPSPVIDRVATSEPRTIVALHGTDTGARWVTATPHDLVALDEAGDRVATLAAPAGAVFDTGATLGSTGILAAVVHRGDANKGGTASIVVGKDGAVTEVALGDPRPIGMTLSDDDRYAFAGGQIIDLAAKKAVGTQTPPTTWGCVTARADRAVCFADPKPASLGQTDEVALFHVPDGAAIEPPATSASALLPPHTAFTFARDLIYIGGCADSLGVVDIERGAAKPPVKLEQSACVRDLEVSDVSGLGVVALASRRVVVWELASGKLLGTLVLDKPLEALALSPSGEYLAMATTDGELGIYHTRSRALVAVTHVDAEAAGKALGLRLAFLDEDALLATTEHRAWRIPWTRASPDRGWRERSPFVRDGRDGVDVVLKTH